jgi:uncharacterized protein (DUF1778 family)
MHQQLKRIAKRGDLVRIAHRYTIARKEERQMASASTKTRRRKKTAVSPLIVRLDKKTKSYLTKAAELRRISVSDYVRMVMFDQARREVEGAKTETIVLTRAEQLTFWKALNAPIKLTPAQRRLARIMRSLP